MGVLAQGLVQESQGLAFDIWDSENKWVVVKIMALFWIPIIIRHLILRVPQKTIIILTTTQINLKAWKSEFQVRALHEDSRLAAEARSWFLRFRVNII